MSKSIEKIKRSAEKLAELRASIKTIEEEAKVKLDALKLSRDEVQNELLAELKKEGLASIKTDNGETYAKGSRKSLEVVNLVFALKWAAENHAYSIDKRIAMQKIAELDEVPNGFSVVENDFISVRGVKKDEE